MTEKKTISASDLELHDITWGRAGHATQSALETKEAVHPLAPGELKDKRLAPTPGLAWDKHCFGLFVPGSDTPEVSVYVALQHIPGENGVPNQSLPGDICAILDKPTGYIEAPNTAIFYSITNSALNADGTPAPDHPVRVTRSAKGFTAGEELIRRVADHLSQLGITCFTTLSPLRRNTGTQSTGFAQWLTDACTHTDERPLFTPIEQEKLADIAPSPLAAFEQYRNDPASLTRTDQAFIEQLLKDLAIAYLTEEKSPARERITIDPVANFHLSNGAQIANIHIRPQGECTQSDLQGAYGVMVNYRYDTAHVESRRADYAKDGTIALDPALARRHNERMANLSAPTKQAEKPTHHDTLKTLPSPQKDR